MTRWEKKLFICRQVVQVMISAQERDGGERINYFLFVEAMQAVLNNASNPIV